MLQPLSEKFSKKKLTPLSEKFAQSQPKAIPVVQQIKSNINKVVQNLSKKDTTTSVPIQQIPPAIQKIDTSKAPVLFNPQNFNDQLRKETNTITKGTRLANIANIYLNNADRALEENTTDFKSKASENIGQGIKNFVKENAYTLGYGLDSATNNMKDNRESLAPKIPDELANKLGIKKATPEEKYDNARYNSLGSKVYQLEQDLANENKSYQNQKFINAMGTIGGSTTSNFVGSVAGGPLGYLELYLASQGRAKQKALNEGATLEQAKNYATGSGAIEVGTEALLGTSLGKATNMLGIADLTTLTNKVTNPYLKGALNTIISALGESGEETVAQILEPALQRATYNKDAKNVTADDLGKAFIQGLPVMTLMSLFGEGVNMTQTPVEVKNYVKEITNKIQPIAQQPVQNTQKNEPLQSPTMALQKQGNDISLPQNSTLQPMQQEQPQLTPIKQKTPDLRQISNMTTEQVNNTPDVNYKLTDKKTTKERSFYENIGTSKIISQDVLNKLEPKTYKDVTNEESMAKALKRINEGGADETINWFAKDIKDTDNIDVAQGIILFEQYQNDGNYNMAVKVVDRLAEIGTRAGQQVQMFALLRRMTPEGMNIYAKRTLQKAFDEAVKGKTKSWIEANQEKFQLTPEDAQFIQNNMEQVTQLEDGRQKDVLLAQIASRIQNKLPPVKGDGLKAYMRISMLLNPKTLLRNVVGNAVIAPVNAVADTFGTGADMLLSKKTGVRTTNLPQLKAIKKGFVEGGAKTINDFVQGINTNRMGNRFEIGKGKSFNENTKSKMLNNFNNKMNALDKVLGTALELGDRPFYEAAFLNSIEGQMKANNVDIPTNDMIDIATTEALERTWQDSNEYTKTVLNIRNALNVVNVKGYGLGDVLIPFAKTPANITKAIVEYSPVNAIKTILEYNGINKALETGQFTPQMQKKFVTDLGKTMSGTLLYILAYGLSQAGVISGGANEDKDVANYERNILGIQPYSFKIGDKSFTYDWMQPVATPFAIMADVVKDENKGVFNTLGKAFKIGGDVLLEQSFLTSFKNLFGYDGIASGLLENVADLPARAVPTLFKQIAEVIDPIARKSYVYNDLKQSMFNKVKAKLPGLSKTLEPVVDTFGNEVKRGSDNGIVRGLNTFLNPSNVAKQNTSKEANEIYRLYKETGDKTIFPREAPNYVTYKNEKIIFTPEQKTTFQKTSGKYVKDTLSEITDNSAYKKLSDEEKAKVINQIVTDSYTLGEGSVGVVTENYEKLQGKMTELENIPVSSYYLAYFAQKDVEGLKDTNGKTIALTASKIKKQRIDEATPNLNNFDRIKLYKIFDISSKVW